MTFDHPDACVVMSGRGIRIWREISSLWRRIVQDPTARRDVDPRRSSPFHHNFSRNAGLAGFGTCAAPPLTKPQLASLKDEDRELFAILDVFNDVTNEFQKKSPGVWKDFLGNHGSKLLIRRAGVARTRVRNFMVGMTAYSKAAFAILILVSALLEGIPTGFSRDKSLLVRSTSIALSTITAAFGFITHPGLGLAVVWDMLLKDRVVVGTGQRLAVVTALIKPAFGENTALYLGVVVVVTIPPMLVVLLYPVLMQRRDDNALDAANTLFNDMAGDPRARGIGNDMAKSVEQLEEVRAYLDRLMGRSGLGAPTKRAFEDILSSALDMGKDGLGKIIARRHVDAKRKNGIVRFRNAVVKVGWKGALASLGHDMATWFSRLWKATKATGKKGSVAFLWLCELTLALLASRNNGPQLAVQVGIAFYAVGRIVEKIRHHGTTFLKMAHLFSLAGAPTLYSLSSIMAPLGIGGKNVFDKRAIRVAMIVLQLLYTTTIMHHTWDMFATAGRCVLIMCKRDRPSSKNQDLEREFRSSEVEYDDGTYRHERKKHDITTFAIGDEVELSHDIDPVATDIGDLTISQLRYRINSLKKQMKFLDAPGLHSVLTECMQYEKRLEVVIARSTILPWTREGLAQADVPDEDINALLAQVDGLMADASSRAKGTLPLASSSGPTRIWPDEASIAGDIGHYATSEIIETKTMVAMKCSVVNTAMKSCGKQSAIEIIIVYGKFDNLQYGAFISKGNVRPDDDGILPIRNWSYIGSEATDKVDAKLIVTAIEEQNYWMERKSGRVGDLKLPFMLNAADIAARPEFQERLATIPSNFDYRAAILTGVIGDIVSFKCLISNPLLPQRQSSVIVSIQRLKTTLLGIVPGTLISSERTAYLYTKADQTVLAGRKSLDIHVIGAGPIAPMIVEHAALNAGQRIKRLTLSSTGQSAFDLAGKLIKMEYPFPIEAVLPKGRALGKVDGPVIVVAAANPHLIPLVTLEDIVQDPARHGAVIIDLSIFSLSEDLAWYILKNGIVICDDIHNVSHRDAQTISRIFSVSGLDMEQEAKKWGIKQLCDVEPFDPRGRHVLFSSSGLASMDCCAAAQLLQGLAAGRQEIVF